LRDILPLNSNVAPAPSTPSKLTLPDLRVMKST
jgi:hypothetical protein